MFLKPGFLYTLEILSHLERSRFSIKMEMVPIIPYRIPSSVDVGNVEHTDRPQNVATIFLYDRIRDHCFDLFKLRNAPDHPKLPGYH